MANFFLVGDKPGCKSIGDSGIYYKFKNLRVISKLPSKKFTPPCTMCDTFFLYGHQPWILSNFKKFVNLIGENGMCVL